MRRVLAIVVMMGIIQCPDLESYWKMQWTCYIPFFNDILSKNCFLDIFWMFHLPVTSSSPQRCIDKISPLMNILVQSFQAHFNPGHNISIDETMVSFKGYVKFKQYCKAKPVKWGLKVYVLAESDTGYVYNMPPYTGRETP